MNVRRVLVASAMAVGLLVRIAPVAAHHSAAEAYDATKKVEAQGTITRVLLKNPHSFVFLEATDENGQKVEWQIEMGAWSGMVTNGWTKEMLAPGTRPPSGTETAMKGCPSAVWPVALAKLTPSGVMLVTTSDIGASRMSVDVLTIVASVSKVLVARFTTYPV